MNAKYVVIDYALAGEVIHIFPSIIKCHDFANDLGRVNNVISAGFVMVLDDGKFRCMGESISLNKISRPEQDVKLINRMFKGE